MRLLRRSLRVALLALVGVASAIPAAAQTAVQFDGTNDYVTFGAATATLGARTFTIEAWFLRTGTGVAVSTGTGGVTAVPLLTKGRGEAEGSAVDANYFLGIQTSNNVLAADFEDASTGLNHPVTGQTVIQNNVWYHAAATYDGATFRLYLNGNLEGSAASAILPRHDSIQHAALGTALNSTGVPSGFFAGALDEARIWDHARPQQGIRDSALIQVLGAPGLLGRWGLDDGSGATAANSVAGSPDGTLTNGPTWVAGSPFTFAYGIRLAGAGGYMTAGDPAALDLAAFTIETWFRRDGAGTTASTGAGGVTAVPLIAKGAAEADGSDVDGNYFLGIDGAGKLAADFEEGAAGASPGLNHPITGTTTIANGVWYHAAATYDGSKWQLFLNGQLEAELVVGQPVRSDSRQHLGLGAALSSAGAATGSFHGVLDETRIWDSARLQSQIQSTINSQITAPVSGLVARWGQDEGAGRVVRDTSGSAAHGILNPAAVTTAWSWLPGAPFNLSATPPADPTGLTASALNHQQVHLAWNDNSNDETGFEIERSSTGPGGPFSLVATVAANSTSHDDLFPPAPSSEFCYRVRAVNGAGASGHTTVECATTTAESENGLDFAGTNAYVTFGNPAALHLSAFTVEAWFRRDGPGAAASTGTGGLNAVPLVTRGRGEAENAASDLNYFLGLDAATGVLAADFEEGAGGASPSLNHPVSGVTAIPVGPAWHHAAATYDGTTWRLYLDGNQEAELAVSQPAAAAGNQHAALASALTTTGAAQGFLDGALDEVRVWSVARTASEIQSGINAAISSAQPNLVGRWSLNEAAGSTVYGSAGTALDGTLTGTGWARSGGAPFNVRFITASAGVGGAISPAGSIGVPDGGSRAFTITSDTGYQVADVLVDGVSVGAVTSYTFLSVTANHTIEASFAPAVPNQPALQLDGVDDHVTFGAAPELGASSFTIEVRFKPTGPGVAVSTGSGGVTAVPLVTKGRGEGDGSNVDMNYFLGIRATDNVLVADFEEGTGQASPGLNHPVAGATPVTMNEWHHAAATYDGTTWRLYLDGSLDATLVVGANRLPQSASIQHAGLGTAMTSAGAAAGYFQGTLDEARIWNVVRSDAEIQAHAAAEVLAGAGLAGRWGLNEGTGTVAGNSIGRPNGTLVNGPLWATDSPIPLAAAAGLRFGGTNAYATFGDPAALDLSQFTIETWFRKDGAGVTANTGTGGVFAVPLVAKGRGEAENSGVDLNYFLGIRSTDGVLVADLEEGAGGASPSLNHPVAGITPIANGVWHHAAATYDGTTWRLYLDGNLEGQLVVGQPAASASAQHAAIASALSSTGVPEGFFDGALDEVRIWDVARTQAEIQSAMNSEIGGPTPNLVARWGLNEDQGVAIASSAGTALGGAITGGDWSWAAGSPFDAAPLTPPDPPSGLTATAASAVRIDLAWSDGSDNEAGFEIERSTTGSGGPFSPLATVAANSTAYPDENLTFSTEYCYRVRAVNAAGASAYAGPACATTPLPSALGLDFGGDTYASFGDPAELRLSAFTIEMWLRRDGPGVGTNTGTGGIPDAIPLIAKGRAENESAALDINYLIGIRAADGVLCADFEEGPAGASPSLNHPVAGATPIPMGSWHHVAVTYDGTSWKLYLDGALDGQMVVGQPPASASNVGVAMASALNSAGLASGFFEGAIDEVRIWSVARTEDEIRSTVNAEITAPQANLVALWALDEGSGSAIGGSAGTTVNGALSGAGFTWVPGAPFDLAFAPDAPGDLTATAISSGQIDLSWTDLSSDEEGFEIERSTAGMWGPYAAVATVPAGATSYQDVNLAATTNHCYRIRAVNQGGASPVVGPACATTLAAAGAALDFGGGTYVGFGDPAALDLAQFTVECWFRRDGPGTTTSTGSGGVTDAIPLVTKGASQADASNVDMNYFLGIRNSDGVLCADFEEGAAGASPGLNHPVTGVTPVGTGIWHHAAATYDGATWRLYLDGRLEATLAVGRPPRFDSVQPAALATSLTSSGTPQGYFDGVLDEARIWSFARTPSQIQAAINAQIGSSETGLVARWGLDEGVGTAVNGSAGTVVNGTISGASYAWVGGAPFDANLAPAAPELIVPANHAAAVGTSQPTLGVSVSDPQGDDVTVTFHGRPVVAGTAGPDFTLIGLPDTQYYTGQLNGGTNAMFRSQTGWVVANLAERNIAYAVQLGDCTEHGDNGGDPIEWMRADTSLSILEDPGTTGLPDGLPYGVCVGNHDQTPIGDADGSTSFYNQYFGAARFQGRSYYGGHYGSNNDNHYQLFSAGGMDFIAICFEYDTTPDAAVLAWASDLLATHAGRRAIVATHNLINTGNLASWSAQGQAIYNALRGHANLFLMLGGHVPGEGRRQDTFNGNTVYSLLSDYQSRTNGGNGWMRILEFSPANNVIRVRTWSPWLGQFEADADSSSQFTLPYDMSESAPFEVIGSVTVPSGGHATMTWPAREPNTQYQWYVTVSDGSVTTTGPLWDFTTAPSVAVDEPVAQEIALAPVTPNPARGHAEIGFQLPRETPVRLSVFDVQGREIALLAKGTFPLGRHRVRWDGRTEGGSAPPGVYLVRLQVPGRSFIRRLAFVR